MAQTSATERTMMVRGEGAISQVGKWARKEGAKKALLVTDPGIVAAGHVTPALESLSTNTKSTFAFSMGLKKIPPPKMWNVDSRLLKNTAPTC